jgi:hypothetical protein
MPNHARKKVGGIQFAETGKKSGDISPRAGFSGREPSMDSEAMENLKNLLLEQNDLTLEELIEYYTSKNYLIKDSDDNITILINPKYAN